MIRRAIYPVGWCPRIRIYRRPLQVWVRWRLWSFHFLRHDRRTSDLCLHRLCEKEGYRMWWHYKKGYPL